MSVPHCTECFYNKQLAVCVACFVRRNVNVCRFFVRFRATCFAPSRLLPIFAVVFLLHRVTCLTVVAGRPSLPAKKLPDEITTVLSLKKSSEQKSNHGPSQTGEGGFPSSSDIKPCSIQSSRIVNDVNFCPVPSWMARWGIFEPLTLPTMSLLHGLGQSVQK